MAAELASESTGVAWLADHGDALYAFAMARLGDPDAAADAVQETLLAALTAHRGYRGEAAARTWLIGILKHKILDGLRRAGRELASGDPGEVLELAQFDLDGRWKIKPATWPEPGSEIERQELGAALADCIADLPERSREIFRLIEVVGVDPAEVRNVFALAPTNLRVLLHRARLKLRDCLALLLIRD
jgi:RNA polymerase sigma-70 factor, ECF subfamily